MTEREKLIQLIKAGHEKASDYFHKEAMAILKQGKNYSSKDRTKTFDEFVADTLIENGIGDIAEWKEKYAKLEKSDTSKEDCTIEQHNEIHYLRNKLKQTEKECDEWKTRANDWKQRFESRDKQCNEQIITGCEALQLKDESIKKYKHRAEVLERALRNSLFDLLNIGCMVIDLGGEKDLTEKYNLDLVGNMPYRIQQAEREIEEERK